MQRTLDDIIKEICQLKEINSINLDAILAFKYTPSHQLIKDIMASLVGDSYYQWHPSSSTGNIGYLEKVGEFTEDMIVNADALSFYYSGSDIDYRKTAKQSDFFTWENEIRFIIEPYAIEDFDKCLCDNIILNENVEEVVSSYINDEIWVDLFIALVGWNYDIIFPQIKLGVTLRRDKIEEIFGKEIDELID